MKNNTKILGGFIFLIFLIFINLSVNYSLQSKIINNVRHIKDVEDPLLQLALTTKNYDTETAGIIYSALLYAQKGDYESIKELKSSYDEMLGEMNIRIEKKAAIVLLGQSQRPQSVKDVTAVYLMNMVRAEIKTSGIEAQVWEALGKGDIDTAYSLAVGEEYRKYKNEIYLNIQNWIAVENEMALSIRKNILEDSQNLIYLNSELSVVTIVALFLVLIIIRAFVVEKNKLYRLLYETSNDAIMTLVPPNWNFTAGNPATIKLFNLKDEKQFISLTPEELSPEKQPDGQLSGIKARKMIEKAMKEGSNSFKWVHKTYRGQVFNADVLLSKVKEKEKTYLQATVRKTD
ncbi:MAG: hypothetical protein NTW66_00665 [Candidatus Magasanikbacteria bacterium]|nr:hypothetical protein [Candidatus Magasanikbacteria bacterium]